MKVGELHALNLEYGSPMLIFKKGGLKGRWRVAVKQGKWTEIGAGRLLSLQWAVQGLGLGPWLAKGLF